MKLWEGNVFTPVCQSFCSRGGGGEVSQHAMDRDVCIPACNGVSASGSRGCTPLDRHPLSRHPPRQTHKSLGRHTTPETDTTTQTDTPPGQTPYPQTPPGQRHPPRQTPTPPKMATEAGGTHPTGMHSCYPCFSLQTRVTKNVTMNCDYKMSLRFHNKFRPQIRAK